MIRSSPTILPLALLNEVSTYYVPLIMHLFMCSLIQMSSILPSSKWCHTAQQPRLILLHLLLMS